MTTKKLHNNRQVFILEKNNEFIKLFKEFISSYPYTQAGLRHQKVYHEQRQKGKENFQAIASNYESGEDITEVVLLQLLPYAPTANNSQRNFWIHHVPAIDKDMKKRFEDTLWATSEDWPNIAQAIFNFVRKCNQNPTELAEACNKAYKQECSHLS
jgi:5-methylcytosine-specific restriction enzyme B